MLEIPAPEIETRRIHGVHIDIGNAKLANLGIEARQEISGRVDGHHPAGRTDCLRGRQCQGPGPAGHVQNLVARRGLGMLQQPIRAKGGKAQRLTLYLSGSGV